ncbi:MAG: aspartyl protease family protein [Thiobacillaceae bacterium]
MPLFDATFKDGTGQPDKKPLLQFGPSILVSVGHYSQPGFVSPTPQPVPTPTEITWALIDTGAGESCIDNALAKRLGLPVIDTMLISGSNGTFLHDVYLAHINIMGLEFFQFGRFAGVDLTGGQQAHGVLLGRTFLDNVMLIYDGLRGQITLTSPRAP